MTDLRELGLAMRDAQQAYFKDRTRENLIASKQAEAAFDKALNEPPAAHPFPRGWVQKKSGSQWRGKIVGEYRTDLTEIGYAVESYYEKGSVQIYPAKALEPWEPPHGFNEPEPHVPQYPAPLSEPSARSKLVASLRQPTGYEGMTSEDSYEVFNETYLRCADEIETLGATLEAEKARAEAAEARVAELEERAHYAEGVADLAMKHRDAAEARAEAMGRALRGCACECTDLSDCPDGLQCAGWIAKTEVIAQGG